MRRARAQPRRPRHALLILFICTVFSPAHTYFSFGKEPSSQRVEQYLVCKLPYSSICLSWKVEFEDLIELPNNITHSCGLSDLKPVPPHRKFIKITPLSMNASVKMSFCSTTNVILMKSLVWKSTDTDTVKRVRRQTGYTPRGRFRGQTQSQYLAINDKNGKEEGKAEAHSAGDSSRASVSGKSGMGQAQSQSVYDPSCDECYGQSEPGAESLKRKPYGSSQFGTTGGNGPYGPGQGAISGGIGPYGTSQNGGPGGSGTGSRPYGPGQGGTAGGTGPYGPGQGGTTGGTLPYGPGQGGTTGGTGSYGPGQVGTAGGTVPYGPGQGGTTGGTGPYGPGQGGTTGGTLPYGPGQGGTTGGTGPYGPGQVGTAGGTVSYGPGQGGTTGGTGPYGPGQGGTTGGTLPYGPGQGGTTGGAGLYGPGQGGTTVGTGPYSPGQAGTTGGTRPYGPGQGGTTGGIAPYGPGQGGTTGGTRPYGPGQGGTTGGTIPYGPGSIGWSGTNGPFVPGGTTGGTVPYGTGQGGTTGGVGSQGPGQVIGPGGTGSYGPNQGGGLGSNLPYGPSQGSPLGGMGSYTPNQNIGLGGIGSYGPIQGGGSGAIGPGQGGGTGDAGNYRPVQISPESTKPYGPSQGIPGATGSYGPSQGGPYGTNWPLVTGVIPGVGTNPTYYCCVVGPNNTPQYVGLDGSNFKIPANVGQKVFNVEPNSRGNGQQPNQVFVPGGTNINYPGSTGSNGREPYNIGSGRQNVPFNTVTGSSQNNLNPPYNTGAGTYETGSNLGPSNLQVPNERYGTGALDNQGNIPYGTGSVHEPNRSYDRGTIRGQNVNGPSGTNTGGPNNLITPTGPYGSDVSGGHQDFHAPNTQYGTGSIGGQPNGQYNTNTGGGQNGLQIPNNQYGTGNIPNTGTGTNTGAGGSNGPYNTGSYGRQNGPYDTGSTGVQNSIPYGVQNTGQQFPGPGSTYGQGVSGNIGPNGSGTGETPSVGSNGGQYSNGIYDYNNQGNTGVNNANSGGPQNVIDPNSIAGSLDGDDSDALASVSQDSNGTVASASSKGGNDKGRAQTQVEGKYTGNGSFSAQAQITDESKGAESQVSGGKQGASSNAQGRGRNNKSQASVQLGSETGSLQTQAQSDGSMHSSNSQVQGSVKGGMADAQARGPGSTSSQAQIGFTPYKDGDKSHELLKTPFVGGGSASAQSSGRTGQSQSQLQGTFKYGITYNGAAQSGSSLDKDAVFSNRLPFNKIDVFDETNKNIDVDTEITTEVTPLPEINFDTNVVTEAKPSDDDESMKNSESRYSSHTHSDHHKPDNPTLETASSSPTSSRRSFQNNYNPSGADYEYTTDKEDIPSDDYEQENSLGPDVNDPVEFEQGEYANSDENYSKEPEMTHQSLYNPSRRGLDVKQSTGGNTQHIVLGSIKDHDAIITQKNTEQRPEESRIYQPGERVPGTGGYTIPIGFTGSVKSVASKDKTYVVGTKDSPSQAQTISLTPGSGKVKYAHPKLDSTYRRSVKPKHLKSLYNSKSDDSNRYVSVSKSVTGALDGDNNVRKQYSHTYYTKSSSCGYFTFTCTIVSGTNGRKKVCKPKIPTNPDGTPMRC